MKVSTAGLFRELFWKRFDGFDAPGRAQKDEAR